MFEAEENADPAAQPPIDKAGKETPAADTPALDEGSEDLFAPLQDAPAAPVQAAPVPTAPARPLNKDNALAPKDDFEELEELPDATLLNEVLSTSAVNHLAGLVRLDADGAVLWSGEVILPTLHRRY